MHPGDGGARRGPHRAGGRGPGRPGTRPWTRRPDGRGRGRPARAHPGRPGRDGAARAGPRLGRPVAGRDGRRGAAATCARCSACAAPRPRPPAPRSDLPPWHDPHNDDPPTPGSGSGTGAAGAGGASARGWPRRWPARPRHAARRRRRAGRPGQPNRQADPPSRPGRPGDPPARPAGGVWRPVGWLACRPPSGPGCCAARRSRRAARPARSPSGHVQQLGALVTGWHGQRWVDLPGGVRGVRRDGRCGSPGQID